MERQELLDLLKEYDKHIGENFGPSGKINPEKVVDEFLTNKGKFKRTSTMRFDSIKCSDSWFGLCSDLYGHLGNEADDEDGEPRSNKICYEMFEHGEYGNIEIVVDEEFNIVGGKIIPSGYKK